MSGVCIYPTLLDTPLDIAASSAWTLRTGGNFLWQRNPTAPWPAQRSHSGM